jgi:hypothetical protein
MLSSLSLSQHSSFLRVHPGHRISAGGVVSEKATIQCGAAITLCDTIFLMLSSVASFACC